jgi:hypothetical protein
MVWRVFPRSLLVALEADDGRVSSGEHRVMEKASGDRTEEVTKKSNENSSWHGRPQNERTSPIIFRKENQAKI